MKQLKLKEIIWEIRNKDLFISLSNRTVLFASIEVDTYVPARSC